MAFMWKDDVMEKYVITVKIGAGIAAYQFDDKERALEIVSQLRDEGADFTTNFVLQNV